MGVGNRLDFVSFSPYEDCFQNLEIKYDEKVNSCEVFSLEKIDAVLVIEAG